LAETGKAITAATRYWEVLDTVPAVVDPPLPRALAQPVRCALRPEAVHLRYPVRPPRCCAGLISTSSRARQSRWWVPPAAARPP